MAAIFLMCGRVAQVDEADMALVVGKNWFKSADGYAIHHSKESGPVLMHRLLMGAEVSQIVDHVSGDRLDNRRSNMRICSHAENMRNRKRHKNNQCGAKGVFAMMRPGGVLKFDAQIRVDKKKIWLGRFDSIEEAARAYRAAAVQYHGEFARPE